ncbi:Xylooligosaccharide oxidase [Drechslerella dactyloides]|uniref:Xylooligosaccharide oxidase n=1 Tax=Drechslerella dactyloides TaxID=74499 RepID=A0AAD6IXG5_DREDA|nr:Xylooligosaccharide oxidase [Drechslerella dactyloides]
MVRSGLLFGVLPLLAGASPVPSYQDSLYSTEQSVFEDCLKAADVPTVLQSTPNFAALALPMNTRMKTKPAVITIPTTAQHVSSTVKCASQFKLKVTPKSGGHAYNAQGLGDGAVVIDLQRFQDVVYDPKTQLARVGGGVRLGNMAQKLYDQGKRGIPHGTCPDVGVGGHSAGGFGWSSRQWGLTVDQMVEVEVVTADGAIRRVNKDCESDLFWALRGAAPSFGVITNFWFKTYEAPENIVTYSYKFTGSVDVLSSAFFEIQKFAETLPKEVGMLVDFLENGSGFRVYGAYYNKTLEQFNCLFNPLLQKLPNPGSSAEVKVRGWIDTLVYAAEGNVTTIVVPETGSNLHAPFYAKSVLTSEDSPLTLEAIKRVFTFATTQGRAATEKGLPWQVLLIFSGGRDSALNNKALLSESSFAQRNTFWSWGLFSFIGNLNEQSNKDSISFLNDFDRTLRRPGDAAYVNAHDSEYTREESHRLVYGSQYQKLSVVKKKWDQNQVFWYPQSIDPAA